MASNTKPLITNPFAQKRNQPTLSDALLVIPTLNEEAAISKLLLEARETGFTNILVVDGFSSDRTRNIAERAGITVVLQEYGKGKGCGVRTGIKKFLEGNKDLLCIIDGDGTNIPSYLVDMTDIVRSAKADVVMGSRTRGDREKGAMGLITLASNLTVSFLLSAKFGKYFTDVQTGYWALTKRAAEVLFPRIQSTGFEIEMELFVNALKEKLRVREIPVGFRLRKGHTKFSFKLRIRNLYYAFKFLAS